MGLHFTMGYCIGTGILYTILVNAILKTNPNTASSYKIYFDVIPTNPKAFTNMRNRKSITQRKVNLGYSFILLVDLEFLFYILVNL